MSQRNETNVIDLAECPVCDQMAMKSGMSFFSPGCRRCYEEIKRELVTYRPECVCWYWCKNHEGWRGKMVSHDQAIELPAAINVEIHRLADPDRPTWKRLYCRFAKNLEFSDWPPTVY